MQRGFTLIELLIALTIIGIVAGISMPQIADTVATLELTTFVTNLAADIRGLQQMSINANGAQVIYTIYLINGSIPQYNVHNGEKAAKIVYLPASVAMTGNPRPIRYSITGTPSSGAQTIEFRSLRTKQRLYIIVAPVTGRVRIAAANTGEWE